MTADERKRRQEERKKLAEERAAEERRDEALVLEFARSVLRDDKATNAEKFYAIGILENLKYYHFLPHDMPFLSEQKDDVLDNLRKRYKAELAGDPETN